MKKSEKKANAKLETARKYVASFKSTPTPTPASQPKPVVKSVKTEIKSKQKWGGNAEVKKMQKGFFFVTLTCNGQKREIPKRFKSVTKANEWLAKHGYISA